MTSTAVTAKALLMTACLAILAFACSDEKEAMQDAGPATDAAQPADTGVATDAGTPDGGSDADGGTVKTLDLTEPMGPGQTRAGKIAKEAELVGAALPKGRIGDFKLYNSKIRVVVEGARPSDGWGIYGGTIAEADVVREAGAPGQSIFGEYFFGFGVRLMDPESVEVVNDGSDGTPAVVRAVGPDKGLPFIDATMFNQVLEATPLDATITTDYVLAPDSDVLEIRTSFAYGGKRPIDLGNIFHAFFMGDGLQYWLPGKGFDTQSMKNKAPYYVMAGRDVSYGFFGEDGDMGLLLKYEGMVFATADDQVAIPRETLTFTRYLAVGGGGADPIVRAYHRFKQSAALGTVSGKVMHADGTTPAAGARVHVLDPALTSGSNHAAQAVAGPDGAYSVEVPAGDYLLVPYAGGHELPAGDPVAVTAGGDVPHDLTLPGSGTVEFAVKDADGAAIPAKVVFDRQEGQAAPGAGFGELVWDGGHQSVVYAPKGAGKVGLPAGTYTVTASRGFEYEIDEQTLALATGQAATITAAIARVVDTTGFVSNDFHIHALASPDSDVLFEDRVASAAAEGVEAPVATEHDVIHDWAPAAQSLGITDWVHPITGSEITTYVYGHFNAWPLTPAPDMPNDGAFVWYDKPAPQLFAEVAAYPGAPVLHVNHPRTAAIGGYFSAALLDRETGTSGKPDDWSEQFDAIEIVNGGQITAAVEEVLPDWYMFLNRGKRFAGASGSDTHNLMESVGRVRNWIASSTDSPGAIDEQELARSVRAQKILVSTGPFISVSVDGKGMGEVVTATGGVDLLVKVQAPTWMDVNILKVVANGVEVASVPIDAATADPDNPVIRYHDTLAFTPSADTWYVVMVEGDAPRQPVQQIRAFAFTNPVYVDVDGNGKFDAPLK